MPISEFQEWQEYYSIYPFGEDTENYRAGTIASAIYNVNRAKKTDKVFTPKDFFPKLVIEEKQSVEMQKQLFREFKAKFRG